MRQAEKAADLYERPLAALFLPEPPAEESEEQQFRRLAGAPEPPWRPEMHLLVRRVRARQDAAAELYDLLDEKPPWLGSVPKIQGPRAELTERIRGVLGIGLQEQLGWRDPSGYTALRRWVDAIEGLGIVVMQSGVLPLEAMRGFASAHPTVPAIVVNTQDDPRARAFTTLHELGHLCLAVLGESTGPRTEEWCNAFAAEVLMPAKAVRGFMPKVSNALGMADEVALSFGVTPRAAAVRLASLGILSSAEASGVMQQLKKRSRASSGGGDYYLSQVGRLGPSFIRLVLSALDGQALTYPAASGLLGVKANNLEKLRGYVNRRSEG
jgi:Zn-dependent peptidase ImmA (M78 family)